MAVEIKSSEELKAWLEDRPQDFQSSIAIRAALRVFPLALPTINGSVKQAVASTVLRALIVGYARRLSQFENSVLSRVEDLVPVGRVRSAVVAAVELSSSMRNDHSFASIAAISAAADGAAHSVAAAFHAEDAAFAFVSNLASTDAAGKAASEIWQVVQLDCSSLDGALPNEGLSLTHLWPDAPDWWSDAWDAARKWLSREEDGFKIWREWYYGRIEGLPHAFADFDDAADEKFYRWIVEQDDDWWKREPAEVNAEIAEFVDDLRKPKDETPVDFFISYSSADESAAREVAAVLDELGKSYIVQYRDFGPENFVTAMNNAMERADKIIPLYSKAYVASKHCNAEWNYFYNLDPSSVERRIVGLKLEDTDLKPLMQQVNYRDLTRYTRAEREAAIREWITWKPRPSTRESISDAVSRQLSPSIVENDEGKLDTEPNREFDVPEHLSALDRAVRDLLLVLDVALDQNHNLPSKMQRSLVRYEDEVRANLAQSAWGGLDRLINILIGGLSQMSSAEFGDGQKEALEELISAHRDCMATLKNPDLERRTLSEISVANVSAEVIADLNQKLQDVLGPLQEAGQTTERLDKHIKDVVEQGRDVAYEAGAPDADQKEQGTKRRYVIYVGGIGLALLDALGSMASISEASATARALQFGKDLVDAFFKAIGL